MQGPDNSGDTGLVSTRTLEVVVALIFMVLAGIVIYDSMRIGISWKPSQGPASGMFPFMMAAGMGLASAITLLRALTSGEAGQMPFLSRGGAGRVAAVLGPLIAYVAMIGIVGVYVAAALLILGFMSFIGREKFGRSLAVALIVPLVAFLMFEKWFLVPLPKGPIETWLGY